MLLGLNGLRVSEARGTDIEDMAFERAHRWVRSIGKQAEHGPVHPHMLRAAFIMVSTTAYPSEKSK